ncbi:ATP-dependent zinc metalloprotease FtsH 1 [Acaryochloris thomasi RCC1774]|uniref:Uncharacterized AAA domain-containing protein ycf46 n=1 Tax=Acaryochloris thomasi RCC1774 TaxID=1764569 RepID=A0A2W1JNZ1_9CYAN|nr:AAA family ATPase [Acaryochloris thomasi]PZD70617.1 ATP-dependent zinc metalloprotease FtsH 1 [Acaryochloris thomasi RCC1774]
MDLINRLQQGYSVLALESPFSERMRVLADLEQWSEQPIYFWSPGYSKVLQYKNNRLVSIGQIDRSGSINSPMDLLNEAGIYLLEGGLDKFNHFVWVDLYHRLREGYTVIALDPAPELHDDLRAIIPLVIDAVPEYRTVELWLCEYLNRSPSPRLVRACLGLHLGALEQILDRVDHGDEDAMAEGRSETIANYVIGQKTAQLSAVGLESMGQPDVEIGGLDQLKEMLHKTTKLFSPEAREAGLNYPKGLILWGLPGTGKSLTTKTAAHLLGMPLLATDWSQIIDDNNPAKAAANLRAIIQIAEVLSPCVLAWDDFEKMPLGALHGILLTWMQERTKPVYIISSVNRLEKLPPEMIRAGRFDQIVFVDLPKEGERQEIIALHLARYTESVEFSKLDWHNLISAFRNCTAAEIAGAVKQAAEEAFCQDRAGQITVQDLVHQRSLFVPSMIRDEDSMLAIRKLAHLARPASGPDNSQWRVPPSEMFEFMED